MAHYMTYPERIRLETLLGEKRSISYIARKLGFSRQTIYNEIRRGTYLHTCDYWEEERYSAQKAQQVTEYNQTAKGRPLKIGTDHAYAEYLEQKIAGPLFACCSSGSGPEGRLRYQHQREHPVQLYRKTSVPDTEQSASLGEMEETSQSQRSGTPNRSS